MISQKLKTPLDDQIQQYLANGGQIRPATNTGKVTTGFEADKERARKKLAIFNSKAGRS